MFKGLKHAHHARKTSKKFNSVVAICSYASCVPETWWVLEENPGAHSAKFLFNSSNWKTKRITISFSWLSRALKRLLVQNKNSVVRWSHLWINWKRNRGKDRHKKMNSGMLPINTLHLSTSKLGMKPMYSTDFGGCKKVTTDNRLLKKKIRTCSTKNLRIWK